MDTETQKYKGEVIPPPPHMIQFRRNTKLNLVAKMEIQFGISQNLKTKNIKQMKVSLNDSNGKGKFN